MPVQMTEIKALSGEEETFIAPYLPRQNDPVTTSAQEHVVSRPFVTLTYACSLDGMISLSPGVRTTLSGPETKSMTHYLRSYHDAILVGVNTAIADDPSLNCRYPGTDPATAIRPVVLDPRWRWSVDESKAMALANQREGKVPWVIHAAHVVARAPNFMFEPERLLVDDDGLWSSDISWNPPESDTLKWKAILKALWQKGIRSVMIEGGATVINDLLAEPGLVDSLIVTVAPTWLGQGGVTVSPAPKVQDEVRVNAARLKDTSWRQFGQDAVLCGRLE